VSLPFASTLVRLLHILLQPLSGYVDLKTGVSCVRFQDRFTLRLISTGSEM
jgi:hypothetical protein